MRNFYAVVKKEMRSYFTSPVAYVVIAIFLILSGFFFYNGIAYFNMVSLQAMQSPYGAPDLNITEWVLRPLFGNISIFMLLMMPLLTMRLFSEEKKGGTIELLFTYPIKDSVTILGKYASCVGVFVIMLLPTMLYPLLIHKYGTLELGPVITGYLGLFLMGSSFIALGLFFSSLTENQIVAAVISFGFLLLFWVIGWSSTLASSKVGSFLTQLSILEHIDEFSKGVVDTKDVVYYLNFIVLCLFLTMRSLESKRWRG